MTSITPEGNKFTLRGKIGSRETRRLRPLSNKMTLMISIYVVSCVLGWAMVGVLLVLVTRS
jgi:hypothetical protein